MDGMKASPVAAVIGDVVGSRRARDRTALHGRLVDTLNAANASLQPSDPLRVTVGDEFQGHYPSVAAALSAAFSVRMALLPEIDTRFGIGWGEVTVLDAVDGTQDGPAWWAARDAISEVKAMEGQAGFRHARMRYLRGGDVGPDPSAIAAALLCRDHLVGSLDERSQRILRGLMEGQAQTQLADREGISPSAVSQRIRSGGLAVIVAAHEQLGAVV
jgi:SatD family (SatD)